MRKLRRMLLISTLLLLGVSIFIFIATPPQATHAAGPWYVAPGGSDINDCSTPGTPCATINGAIGKASSGDVILVATGTYTGTGSDVVSIDRNLTLSGGWDNSFLAQNSMSTIDGQASRRGISVNNGVNATVDHFAIQNCNAFSFPGGIWNGGALTVTNSAIINNSVTGIRNSGTLVLANSTVAGNLGGGVFALGTVTITQSSISGNTVGAPNTSGGGGGAGIENWGTVFLNNSTVSNNLILGFYSGAGIDNIGTLTVNNSTISGNTGGYGGGINSSSGTINLSNSTISKNSGAGVAFTGFATVQNSILADNDLDCNHVGAGSFTSLGYNLIRSTSTCPLAVSDLTNIDPLLYPLQFNGGGTKTLALLPTSPAINGGNPAGCTDESSNPLSTDERGMPRYGRCDIGAFELQPIEYASKTANPTTLYPGNSVSYTISLVNPTGNDLTNVVVTDTIPITLTFANNSLSASSGSYGYSSGVISWTGTINAASNVTITFGANLASNSAGRTTIVNSAVISGAGEIFTRTASINIPPYLVYLPLIQKCYPLLGIFGNVTSGGAAASGVGLNLRFYNGSTWSTIATTTTDGNGDYKFQNAPNLSAGQGYYVQYSNGADNTRLSFWGTRTLTSYTGCNVNIGNFDLANIMLVAPANTATISLPGTFQWTPRAATPSDSYEFELFNPGNPPNYTPTWWTVPPLGYVGSYLLNSLPAGFSAGVQYGWFMAVYSPDGGYGESFYYRAVTFSNTGFGPILRAPASSAVNKHDAPHPKTAR